MAISEKASLSMHLPGAASVSEAGHTPVLPETPLIKIRASKRWSTIELHEIWAHRELLYFLVWRDLKVRYNETILDTSWIILQPILMSVVLVVSLAICA